MQVDPYADWAIAALALAAAFRLGAGLGSRRAAALAGVVRAFAAEVSAWREAVEDGEITDAEAREIARMVDRFFSRVADLGGDLLRREGP